MSLKFTALEIGSGDAFLLEDGERKILFDSGGNKTKIVTLLKKKGITKIDLAICSHNDVDHANGFIGLLNSDIDIDEIWLPGLWANLLQFVKDNGIVWEKESQYIKKYENFCMNKNEFEIDTLFDKEKESISMDTFDDELSYFSELIESSEFHEDMGCLYYQCIRHAPNTLNLIINLDRIIKIAGLAYQKGSKMRWFEPLSSQTKAIGIGYNFFVINAREMCVVQKIKELTEFLFALKLTDENRYSLVFEYQNNNSPIIRFSADSDCTYQSYSPYVNNIIVTAPHHGSDANAIVYKNLKGKDIIWVRSDRKSSKRPCVDFKKQPRKYCLACRNRNFKSEIHFEFQGNKWQHKSGNNCTC